MDIKLFFHRLGKRIKRRFRKIKKFFKKYIRVLVRHTKAKDYSVLIYTIVFWLVFILLFSFIFRSCRKNKDDDTTEITTEISTPSDAIVSTELSTDEITVINLADEAKRIYETEAVSLILVNAQHPIPADYSFSHHTLNCGYDINSVMYEDLVAMLNACNAAGFEYNIFSAYRNAESSQPKDDAGDNTSEHLTGLAIDLASLSATGLGEALSNDVACQWLQANCHNYGFVLRYPADKTDKTSVSYQPWHFRYVGKNAAIFMHDNNLTLEEFHELLGQ